MKFFSSHQGYTLLEILFGFLITSILLFLLMQNLMTLFHQVERSFDQINEVLEYEWLSDLMRQRLHLAGEAPCQPIAQMILRDLRDNPESLVSLEITPDHIIFRHIEWKGNVLEPIDARTFEISTRDLNPEYPVWIGDCTYGEIHQIEQVIDLKHSSKMILSHPIQKRDMTSLMIGEWVTESFFIRHQHLFYHYHHTDEVSPWVSDFSAQWMNHSKILQIRLTWKEKERILEIKENVL